ncbi:MAG: hypothetical protein H0X02_00930 [Nitrosomonas sp.]|nr:hypothetical protein [Nitrosomonas sp.]
MAPLNANGSVKLVLLTVVVTGKVKWRRIIVGFDGAFIASSWMHRITN